MNILTVLVWFSSLAFIYFGISCFTSKFIIQEFTRYGLKKYKKLTGCLQTAGAIGLLIGLYFNVELLFLSASGLTLLMLAGFIIRLKIKDNFIQSSPSFLFAVLNLFIAVKVFVEYF